MALHCIQTPKRLDHESAVDLLFSKEDLFNHPKTFHTQWNSFYNGIE